MRAATAPTPEPAQADQPATPATPASDQPLPDSDDADHAPADDGADPGEDPPEGDDGADAAEPEGDEDPAPKGEEEDDADGNTMSTVEQLLEHTELDPEAFGALKINVKVDRETKAVPVSELIKSYQIGEAATKRLEDAKVKAASITSDAEAKRETVHASLSSVAKLLKSAEDLLEQDVKAIDWNDLRAKDPAEYAAKKEEIRERREKINALKKEGADAWRDAVALQRDQTQANLGETIADQKVKLLEAIPEWSDPQKAKADIAKMTDFLVTKRNFSKEEIVGTTDYRLLVLARDAWQAVTAKSKTTAALKKVAKIPKTLKPGSQGGSAPKPKEKTLLEDLYGTTS